MTSETAIDLQHKNIDLAKSKTIKSLSLTELLQKTLSESNQSKQASYLKELNQRLQSRQKAIINNPTFNR